MTTNTVIQIESPRAEGVPKLISDLDGYLSGLYPPESNHFLGLDELARPDIRFFVARREGKPLACGALRIAKGYGELKRMYVAPAARGRGLGRAILERLESEARREGLPVMRLETGNRQAEALSLYRSAGYVDCGPFGDYRRDPLSRFMEKRL